MTQISLALNHRFEQVLLDGNLSRLLPAFPPSDLERIWSAFEEDENTTPIVPRVEIDDFFCVCDLNTTRMNLHWIMKIALESKNMPRDLKRINSFILLYEKIDTLVTANYILHMKKQQRKRKKREQE